MAEQTKELLHAKAAQSAASDVVKLSDAQLNDTKSGNAAMFGITSLKQPLSFSTSDGNIIYDIATQGWWMMHGLGWLQIVEVPQRTITKEEAKVFRRKCPAWNQQLLEEFPKLLPGIKTTGLMPVDLLPLVYWNAMHDSVLVKRNKKNTGLAQFYIDKIKMPFVASLPPLISFLRPEYVTGCPCHQLQTYGNVIYCPACTTFRVQVVQNGAVVTQVVSMVGKLTFFKPTADALRSYCVDPRSGRWVVDATFSTFCSVFHLANLQNIPAPKEVIIEFILRDSLFARNWNEKTANWASWYQVQETSFGAGDALVLIRLGLAIGTLGMIS